MTLIGIATYGDRAEFITDTASYTHRVTHMGTGTKHLLLPHIDAAALSQGGSVFGAGAKGGLLTLSENVSFDVLAEGAPAYFRAVWDTWATPAARATDSTVFLVGYSSDAGRFVLYAYASEDGFEQREIPGLFVTPSPWQMRPSDVELDRFRRYVATRDDAEQIVAAWCSWDPGAPPRTTADWAALAAIVRHDRALQPFAHVIVAGRVLHTRLERGSAHTRVVHEFNDSGEEFLRLVAPTHHPQAQLASCLCGSGRRSIDCCLVVELGEPCGCGSSGKTFGDCCRVDR